MGSSADRLVRRPAWVGALNTVARGLAALRLDPLSLSADALVERACRDTGLDDFGGDGYREPLELMVRDLLSHPGVTPFAKLFMRRFVTRRLVNRLRIAAALAADPSIARQPIERPLFVLGLPRTGTTLLHRLLAVDPANRAPLTWEMDEPVPPPALARDAQDPRSTRSRREIATLDRVAPNFRAIHELGAELPEECIALMANDLTSVTFLVGLDLPAYREWLYACDLGDSYASHRRQLQLLQSQRPTGRWVLKAPFHLHGLPWLLGTYPDACIVQTHRGPLRVMPSVASLMMTMRDAFLDGVSPAAVGEEMVTDLSAWLERAIETRSRAEADVGSRARFIDVHYADVVADPIAVVRRIYGAFDFELSEDAEQRMREFLANNRQHKHGKHRYTLGQFAMDPAATRARFAAYCERFSVDCD